ncbi:MAG: GTP-binding protein [Micrococcaceae bacterium]
MSDSQGRSGVETPRASPAPVIAVVGTCEAERREYARSAALAHLRLLVPAEELSRDASAVERALGLAAMTGLLDGLVVECPDDHCVPALIGELADPDSGARLQEVVCVIDAAHLLPDLAPARHSDRTSRQRATALVELLEFSSAAVVVNHDHLAPRERARVRRLLAGLNPTLRWIDDDGSLVPGESLPAVQDRAGWIRLLNDEHPTTGTHDGVTVWRYEQLRPFHPERLKTALERIFTSEEHGTVVRSVGFCHLASRSHVTQLWEYSGRSLSLSTLGYDQQVVAADEVLAWGQDVAFIGLELDVPGLSAELDQAVLNDAELTAGPEAWRGFSDPFLG